MPGTGYAKSIEPDENYILPFGNAAMVTETEVSTSQRDNTLSIITYGMGVHWALNAAQSFESLVEIVDLRTLYPLDEKAVLQSVRKNSRCLVVTEEPVNNSFARSLAGMIQEKCFRHLDAPVMTIGAENMPAIPLNSILEETMLPSTEKVKSKIEALLSY